MRSLVLIPEHGEYDALVDKVIDGDTLNVLLFVPVKVRLAGVQVSETGTAKGDQVAKLLADRLTKQIVSLFLQGKEKYGRTLARVRLDGIPDVSDWLIGLGLAAKWDGKGPRPVGIPWQEATQSLAEGAD